VLPHLSADVRRTSARSPDASTDLRREADAALAAALVAREPDAARRAFVLLTPLVMTVLRGHGAAGLDGQDLCQEVFLRFFARIRELRDPRALRNFVIGICLGVAQNERRRALVRSGVQLAPDGELPDQPVPPADADAREAVRRLDSILAGLDPEARALFIIRYVEKMELADIAAASGWALSTTKRRVARVTRRVGLRMRRDPALADYVGRLPELPGPAPSARRGGSGRPPRLPGSPAARAAS
jgi:RNA polymerase sigma-70 factor (ECF subfamily)